MRIAQGQGSSFLKMIQFLWTLLQAALHNDPLTEECFGAAPSLSLVFIPATIEPADTAKKSDLIKNAYSFNPPAEYHENKTNKTGLVNKTRVHLVVSAWLLRGVSSVTL